VKIKKTQFLVASFVFLLLFSFSLIEYVQNHLHAIDQKRWDKYIFSAPEQVSIQSRTYILYALTYYNAMPGPEERNLAVSWELGADGFIFPIPLELILITKAWLINYKDRFRSLFIYFKEL